MPAKSLKIRTILTSTQVVIRIELGLKLLTCTALFLSGSLARGSDQEGIEYFETHIRPLFVEHCYECHSADAKKLKASLHLDSRSGWQTGGDSGPAIIPGNPEESLLIQAVSHSNGDLEMPPKNRLPETAIEKLKTWISMGAPDPREGKIKRSAFNIDLEEGRKFWAFKPPVDRPIPKVKDSSWPANEIDHFILSRLESENLTPNKPAPKATLLRRITYDLIGLPPSPEEMKSFLADPSPSAFAKIVDNLLARPEFGERWGRHWLDVTRFAESSGGGRSLIFPDAWRFRDYVIASFNQDKPYDQLIREHLAGDLLPHQSPQQRNDQLIGSGYLVLGALNYELQDHELLKMEFVDEQIDSVGRTFLGMTLGCARCHDHKFDPIPATDYYALAGIFQSTRSMGQGSAASGVTSFATTKLAVTDPTVQPITMAPTEAKTIADGHLHIRGQVRNKGAKVPRGFLTVAMQPGTTADIPANHSGRLELAHWIADPEHPLTARIMANRIWKHLLGQGLVRTPDNFGKTGELPSHPELLDHLALRFVQNKWSVKSLIRQIALSRTYQLSSQTVHNHDPENRLLSRAHRKRLEAEPLRDTILKISGSLDPTRGGLTIRNPEQYDLNYTFKSNRRSIYLPWFRNSMLDLFEVFDAPNPNLVVGQRSVTNLPTQALFLMNSPFIRKQASLTAQRLIKEKATIPEAYQLILSRPPTESEKTTTQTFLKQFPANQEQEAWTQLAQTLFATIDFRFLD